MSRKLIFVIGSGILAASLILAGACFARLENNEIHGGSIQLESQAEAEFPSLAKIVPGQADQAALVAVPGKILKTELENENGFLVYGIEVVTADRNIVGVTIDAGSGKILAMNQDKVDDEGHESGNLDTDRDEEE